MRKNGIAVGPPAARAAPALRDAARTAAAVRLEESVKMANRDGELFEFNVFAATLGHSAGTYSSVEDQDDRRPGQVHVRHDREARRRAARVGHGQHVRPGDGQGRPAPQVQRAYEFAKAAGFELKLCRPRSPQTKGKVESSNRFLSRLMAYQGDFDGWDDIDEIVARIEDASNSEPNETTGLPPSALFMEEKDALLPVGNLRALPRRWATWCAWPGCRPRCW